MMKSYQQSFIEQAIRYGALRFGQFTLKSGRSSPYFFDMSRLFSGACLRQLGQFYVKALMDHNIDFDLCFGPAYKGIPLASSVSIAMSELYQKDIPVAFNRKERKQHGEGGIIIGSELTGNVVIVDDVITAGTAIREAMTLIQNSPSTAKAIVVGFDRQELGKNNKYANEEVSEDFKIPVISIVRFDHIIEYLQKNSGMNQQLDSMIQHRKNFSVPTFSSL